MAPPPPPPSPPQTTFRQSVTHWLDTHGRVIAESPLNPLSTAALTLSLLRPARATPTLYPRAPFLVFFSGVYTLSGFMAWEGHTVDAAGTQAVWASLYLMINGWKRGLRPVFKGRVMPAVVAGKCAFDAVVGGWYWLNTRRWVEGEE